jgi:acetyl esterase/lipase
MVTTMSAPVPFDPELAAVLAGLGTPSALTPDLIPLLREGDALGASDEELSRDGAFEISERLVPGPDGAPEVSLLICRPTGATAPTPVVYNIHGGGMITGTNRLNLPRFLGWAEELRAAVVSVKYRRPPETPHPGPGRARPDRPDAAVPHAGRPQ